MGVLKFNNLFKKWEQKDRICDACFFSETGGVLIPSVGFKKL